MSIPPKIKNFQDNLITIVEDSFLKEYVKKNFQFRSEFKKLEDYVKSFDEPMKQIIIFLKHDKECERLSKNGSSYIKDYFERLFSTQGEYRNIDDKFSEEQINIYEENQKQEEKERQKRELEEKLEEKLDRYLEDRFVAEDRIKLRTYHTLEYERIKKRSEDEANEHLDKFELEANWNKLEKQDKRYLKQIEQKAKEEKKKFEENKKIKKEDFSEKLSDEAIRYNKNEEKLFQEIEEWKKTVDLKREWEKKYNITDFEIEIEPYRSGANAFSSKNQMKFWLYQRFAKFIRRATLGKDDLIIYKKNNDFSEESIVETAINTFRNSQKNFIVYFYISTNKTKSLSLKPYLLLEETNKFNYDAIDWIPYHPLKTDPSGTNVLNTFVGHHFTQLVREHLKTHSDLSLTAEEMEKIKLFRDPLKNLLLSGEEEAFIRLENFITSIVQDPTQLFAMQLFMRQKGGGGSTTLLEEFLLTRVLGGFTAYKTLEHATKEFNGPMYKKTNILIREAKPKSYDTVNAQNDNKDDITDPTFQLRLMYREPMTVKNVRHWWCLSNNLDSFQVNEYNKRRYRIYKPSEDKCNDIDYFSKLRTDLLNKEMAFLVYRYYSSMKVDNKLLHEEFCTKLMENVIDDCQTPAIKFLNDVASGYFDSFDLNQLDIFERDLNPNIIWINKKDFYKQFKNWLTEKYVKIPNIPDCKFYKDIKNEKILGHTFYEVPEGKNTNLNRIKIKLHVKHFQEQN